MKKHFKIVIIIVILGAFILDNFWEKVVPFKDKEGNIVPESIAKKEFIEVNGTKLGMFIRGKNINNPVLLFLHGGPGMPEYFLKQEYPVSLEDHFTVVWLEQRGTGLSYNRNIDPKTITMEQFIKDDTEVTKYLCKKFHKDKIYLMAHSWGTTVGIRLARLRPELYQAYIAMGQITDQARSEQMAYEYMLDFYAQNHDTRMVKKLKKGDENSKAYKRIRDAAMHKAGIGTARNMNSVITGIFIPSLECKEYSLPERINIWRGLAFTKKAWYKNEPDMGKPLEITQLKIPVYFFHGKYDYTVNYDLARQYYEQLKAPVKRFYTFENSAHSPLFEEPDKAVGIMTREILQK